jgi:hypothetical protein
LKIFQCVKIWLHKAKTIKYQLMLKKAIDTKMDLGAKHGVPVLIFLSF